MPHSETVGIMSPQPGGGGTISVYTQAPSTHASEVHWSSSSHTTGMFWQQPWAQASLVQASPSLQSAAVTHSGVNTQHEFWQVSVVHVF